MKTDVQNKTQVHSERRVCKAGHVNTNVHTRQVKIPSIFFSSRTPLLTINYAVNFIPKGFVHTFVVIGTIGRRRRDKSLLNVTVQYT